MDLTDEELIDHISEMCVMSKSLEEYEGELGGSGARGGRHTHRHQAVMSKSLEEYEGELGGEGVRGGRHTGTRPCRPMRMVAAWLAPK